MSANKAAAIALGNPPATAVQKIASTGLTSTVARSLLEQDGPNATPDTSVHPLRSALTKFWAPVPWLLEASIVLQMVLHKYFEAAINVAYEGFDSLAELALDMRWSWNHATDKVWRQLDPELWEITRNPWVVLQTVSRDQIECVLADSSFRKNVEGLIKTRRQALEAPAWFQQNHSQSSLTCAAYFSMEFMLSEALPIYSGGLGNVAGDQLKANSDLGVPVIGVGLPYQQGYFRQLIDKDGAQQANGVHMPSWDSAEADDLWTNVCGKDRWAVMLIARLCLRPAQQRTIRRE